MATVDPTLTVKEGKSAPANYAQPDILQTPVQFVKGVGPAASELLKRLDIQTAGDLLRHYPRRYEDRTHFREMISIRPGETICVAGTVLSAEAPFTRHGPPITRVTLQDATGYIECVWFNQPYLLKRFRELASRGGNIVAYGLAQESRWGLQIQSPEWEEMETGADSLSWNRIVPIYPATEGLRQGRIRRMIDSALTRYVNALEDVLPDSIRKQHHLLGIKEAIKAIHFPDSESDRECARRRLVFEEFFLLQVSAALRRLEYCNWRNAIRMNPQIDPWRELSRLLPFDLTLAQRKAIEAVIKDMASGSVMNRLLQGDVGSGKTVVAMAAMLYAALNGYQAALMVPTEILAQQHAMVFRQLLADSDWQVELATGSMRAREKRHSLARLADGSSSFAIGTHALIQEGVEFRRLALVVVDEQHRFGVLQRQALQLKSEAPHVLVMTATPIPRTLTMTLYGDLDVSVLDEMPPNRRPIRTYWRQQGQRSSVYQGLQKLLDQGRQAYIVCPLVEQSERLQARAARELAEEVAKERLLGYRIGLLHGQMNGSEKEKIMLQFRHHDLDVLVATSVIEVGVDVPNATVIIIENAERFGLSQLHQLRGRVGRGEHLSYCLLLADPQSDDAFQRLQVMAQTSDGFKIAEEDLRIRGAGEFFGVKQSGAADLRLGNLITDVELLEESRQAAVNIVETDPALARWPSLRKAVAHVHPSTELATIG